MRKYVPQLIRFGRIIRPVLGVEVLRDRIARRNKIKGVIVLNVHPGKGAARAGMKGMWRDAEGQIMLGDVIVSVNKFRIGNQDDLLTAMEQYKPGDVVTVKTVRQRKKRTFSVRLTQPD